MSLSGDARAQAVFATCDLSNTNATEQQTVLNGLKALFGADTTYLTTNAVIQPGTMQDPAGATVLATGVGVAPGSPLAITAAVAAPTPITGTGLLT